MILDLRHIHTVKIRKIEGGTCVYTDDMLKII